MAIAPDVPRSVRDVEEVVKDAKPVYVRRQRIKPSQQKKRKPLVRGKGNVLSVKDKEGKTVYKKDKDGNMVSDSKNILIKVGKPTLSAERWLAELSLKLALKPKADKEKDKEAAAAGAKRKLES